MLERRSSLDQRTVEVHEWSHRREAADGSKRRRLVLVVNDHASGIDDPRRTASELTALLQEHGAQAEAVVTASEEELWRALGSALDLGRRVVLVGGDGTLHAAANAPLRRLPELALVPAGRANNIARALDIPTSRRDALAVAAEAPARPLDALRVATPDRLEYALEAVSAGFQADARSGYNADNSSDLRQGVRALLRAIVRYRPYTVALRLGARRLRSSSAAQVFFSNLPYFGFGFEVDPGANSADGRFETILLEARGRSRLLWLLGAAWRGRHLGKRGVTRVPTTRAQLTEPLPLVADAIPLGTTTATVTVEPARLRVASPVPGAAIA
jgi:diacylglycerol kinase (ATP)